MIGVQVTIRANPLFKMLPIETIGNSLADDLSRMDGTYEAEVIVNDVKYLVRYEQHGAVGDSGRPVRGDVTGDFEVVYGDSVVARQHVSPHGTSGYGNPYAKHYSAQKVGEAIARHAQRHLNRGV